jgi:hypothetical protein
VIEPEPNSVSSEDFQDFESYQSHQPPMEANPSNSTAEEIPHSSTNDSLAEIQGKMFTPSLVSSGYGSQAVSMLTLSSEDSLSIFSGYQNYLLFLVIKQFCLNLNLMLPLHYYYYIQLNTRLTLNYKHLKHLDDLHHFHYNYWFVQCCLSDFL